MASSSQSSSDALAPEESNGIPVSLGMLAEGTTEHEHQQVQNSSVDTEGKGKKRKESEKDVTLRQGNENTARNKVPCLQNRSTVRFNSYCWETGDKEQNWDSSYTFPFMSGFLGMIDKFMFAVNTAVNTVKGALVPPSKHFTLVEPEPTILPYFHLSRGHMILAVLIHGLGDDKRVWEPLVGDLAEFVDVLTVDLRGHGLAKGGPEQSFIPWNLARDVYVTVRSVAGPKSPTILIGHSYGAFVATCYAKQQEQVLHVINVDGSMDPKIYTDVAVIARASNSVFDRVAREQVEFHRQFVPPQIRQMLQCIVRPSREVTLKCYGVSSLPMMHYLHDRMTEVSVPYSFFLSDNNYVAQSKEAVPNASVLTFHEAGHYLFLTQRHAFLAEVKRVVARALLSL